MLSFYCHLGTVRVYDDVKAQLRSLIKVSRGFFRPEATQEMLDEFRPLLCSTDRSMWIGFKYLATFLPTLKKHIMCV